MQQKVGKGVKREKRAPKHWNGSGRKIEEGQADGNDNEQNQRIRETEA